MLIGNTEFDRSAGLMPLHQGIVWPAVNDIAILAAEYITRANTMV